MPTGDPVPAFNSYAVPTVITPTVAPIAAPAPVSAPARPILAPSPGIAGAAAGTDFASLFQPASVFKVAPRLAISLDAMDKSGKTHYALFTTPEPVAIIFTDPGTPAVIEKAVRAGRKIAGAVDLRFEGPSRRDGHAADKATWQAWIDKWDLYKRAIRAAATNPKIKTVVKDTETETWELCQLAFFGKMDKIPQHLRVQCNNEYLATFRELYAREDLNIVLIHQCKKEYKPNSKGEDSWTGQYERAGMNKIGFQVDLVVRCGWDGVRRCFYTAIPAEQATRYGGGVLSGRVWYGEESGFGLLGMEVFPETVMTPEVWGL